MKVLVVDDSAESRRFIEAVLRSEGHSDLLSAGSAPEAFERLGIGNGSPPDTGISLVVMDLQMPGMNGLEACRRVRSVEALRDLPIIVVTASTEDALLKEAFEAGAVDFIHKPVNPVELSSRVRSVLRLKEEMDRRKQRERELLEVTRDLERVNLELQRLSSLDGLTGIPNRRRFDIYLEEEWKRASRMRQPLSVILLDIDHFKKYNDQYGHLAGDECLKQVAGALREMLRRPSDLVARYGGEEFVAILPGTTNSGAVQVAESMRQAVVQLDLAHAASSHGQVTVSLGAATGVPEVQMPSTDLVDAADRALYRAKQDGRNRVSS